MESNKATKRNPKQEILEQDFHSDVEEAKSLRDVERLEKEDSQLWLLTIFIILVLTFFMVVKDFDPLKFSPGEFLGNLRSLKSSALVLSAAVLFLGFCSYILFRNRRIRAWRREIFVNRIRRERMVGTLEEVMALFQISSGISNHKEVSTILEKIARGALTCLKAHRSTLFLLEEKSGILKTQFTYSSDSLNEQVGLFEEKELARKALRQNKPFLLREPKDFAEFFKYEERDRKMTSLMSIPLSSQGKGVGVLSAALIEEERSFTERDLHFLLTLGNFASIAFENSYLFEEVRKGISFRKNYEQYLDHILNQLQTLSGVERRRIEDHIGRLLPVQADEPKPPLEEPSEEMVKGKFPLPGPRDMDRQGEESQVKMLRVDHDAEPLSVTHDLGEGGVFIRTPNPLDLGERFPLRLHLAEGEKPIEVTCKVIWTNKYGKESRHLRRGMGVKFLNLSPEFQNRVDDFIRSNQQKGFSLVEDQHLSVED